MRWVVLLLGLVSCAFPKGIVDSEGYTKSTLRKSDIPKDAPTFASYPAVVQGGKHAPLRWSADPDARMFKTRLLEWNRMPVNFAGHYILATWGCGAECVQFMVIDVKTGNVFHPDSLTSVAGYNVHEDVFLPDADGCEGGLLRYRAESDLLVVIGAPNEDESRRGVSYYVWKENRFRRVRFVPKPTE